MSTSRPWFPADGRRRPAALPALLMAVVLGACAGAPTAPVADPAAPGGPRARIAVAAFEDKTAKGAGEIGDGMAAMLTTALVNSNRFIVLERDALAEVLREQDLGAGGRVQIATAAPVGEVEGAELLVIGAVTAFEPEALGIGGGLLGLGTLIGTAMLHEKNSNIPVATAGYLESHVALDLRVVDAATSRVLFSTAVEARGYAWGGGVIAEVGGGRSRLPLAFGGYQKTATETAVRNAIALAVADLSRRTPPGYFRHRLEDFEAGRMAAFAYLDVAGISGERFEAPGLRVASTAVEWAALAADLGLAGTAAAPPVDFAAQRVAAVFAGAQPGPGATVSIERAVAYPDRVELTAALVPPPTDGKIAPTPALLRPMALVRLEQGPPMTLVWRGENP